LEGNIRANKKLLILGASEIQTPLIKRAKEMGIITIVADYNPDAPGFEFADVRLSISTNDIPTLLNAAIENKIDGVITSSDLPVRCVAHICNEMKLCGPSLKSADLCTNKYLLRQHLSQNNFLVPKFRIINSKDMLREIDFFPSVIKPVDSSASRGVQKVINMEELISAYDNSIKYSTSSTLIVEEYIHGDEYSVESLTQDGVTNVITITEKSVFGDKNKYFVETRHIVPATLLTQDITAISGCTINAIDTLDLRNSPSHTELKITKKGIFIIEIGARLGGDYITSDLIPLSTGVDMLENAINIALNNKIRVVNKFKKYSCIQFVTNDNYDEAVNYLNKNNSLVVKYEIKPYKAVILKNSFDRLGYFIIHGESKEQLLQTLNSMRN